MSQEYDYLIKLIIVGDSYVGKSSLMNVFCDNYYSNYYCSTIGVDFKTKMINVNNKKVKIQIWDTAGQERFRSIVNSYYHGVQCVILMFDFTNNDTFKNLDFWYKNIEKNINCEHKILLVGSKIDDKNNIVVDRQLVQEFAVAHNMDYVEISSKNNINTELVFYKLITDTINDSKINIKPKNFIKLSETAEEKTNRKCCF